MLFWHLYFSFCYGIKIRQKKLLVHFCSHSMKLHDCTCTQCCHLLLKSCLPETFFVCKWECLYCMPCSSMNFLQGIKYILKRTEHYNKISTDDIYKKKYFWSTAVVLIKPSIYLRPDVYILCKATSPHIPYVQTNQNTVHASWKICFKIVFSNPLTSSYIKQRK